MDDLCVLSRLPKTLEVGNHAFDALRGLIDFAQDTDEFAFRQYLCAMIFKGVAGGVVMRREAYPQSFSKGYLTKLYGVRNAGLEFVLGLVKDYPSLYERVKYDRELHLFQLL